MCRYIFLMASLVLWTLPLSANLNAKATHLNANNDHGFWLEENIIIKAAPDWTVKFHIEQRWGADYRLFWNQRTDFFLYHHCQRRLGLFPDLVKEVGIALGYGREFIIKKNTRGIHHWIGINKAIALVNMSLECFKWRVGQCIRWDYLAHTRKHYIDHAVYRYCMAFYTPWKWTKLQINPYFSDELFFRKNTYRRKTQKGLVGGWHQNRLKIGIRANLYTDKLSTQIYWQWRTIKHAPGTHPRWFNTYQLGLAINLAC